MGQAPADQAGGIEFSESDNGLCASGRSRRRPPDLRPARRRPSPSPQRPLAARFAQPVHRRRPPCRRMAGRSRSAQLELSDTAVFDQPQAGPGLVRGRHRATIWTSGAPTTSRSSSSRGVRMRGKKRTPGRFSTRGRHQGRPSPASPCATSRSSGTKAYFKEGTGPAGGDDHQQRRADFDLKKTLNAENWRALRRNGGPRSTPVSWRPWARTSGASPTQRPSQAVVLPTVHDGQRAPGLRFGDPRTVALFGALCLLRTHLLRAQQPLPACRHAGPLRSRLHAGSGHLRPPPAPAEGLHRAHPRAPTVTASLPMGARWPRSSPRLVTRVVVPTLTDLARPAPPVPRPLAIAWRKNYEKELRSLVNSAHLAA